MSTDRNAPSIFDGLPCEVSEGGVEFWPVYKVTHDVSEAVGTTEHGIRIVGVRKPGEDARILVADGDAPMDEFPATPDGLQQAKLRAIAYASAKAWGGPRKSRGVASAWRSAHAKLDGLPVTNGARVECVAAARRLLGALRRAGFNPPVTIGWMRGRDELAMSWGRSALYVGEPPDTLS